MTRNRAMKIILTAAGIIAVCLLVPGCGPGSSVESGNRNGHAHEGDTHQHAEGDAHQHAMENTEHTHDEVAEGGHTHGDEPHQHAEDDAHQYAGEDAAHVHDTATPDGHSHEAEPHQHDGTDAHVHDAETPVGHTHEGETQSHAHSDDAIHLSDAAADNLGIKLLQVASSIHYDSISIPGTVEIVPDRRVDVSAPIAVRIIALDAPPHSTVLAGQRLATVELIDPEIRQLQMHAVEVRAEILADSTELARTRQYLESLLSRAEAIEEEIRRVRADLDILEARARARQSALDAVIASLKVAGLSKSQLEALESEGSVATRITLFAPRLKGSPDLEVAARPVSVGETVAAGGLLYSLVALDRLLAMGEAFEADLPAVRHAARENLPVVLLFPAEGRVIPDLRIQSVEGTLDGENRVTHFFVPFHNRMVFERTEDGFKYQDWENRAGSRVQIRVATQQVGPRYVVPAAALVKEAGQVWIFRKSGDAYERLEVRVDSTEGQQAVLPLDCGLREDDRLVAVGALQLNLAIKQQQGGETTLDHGHQH